MVSADGRVFYIYDTYVFKRINEVAGVKRTYSALGSDNSEDERATIVPQIRRIQFEDQTKTQQHIPQDPEERLFPGKWKKVDVVALSICTRFRF